jgi:hypothetical protein
LLVTIQSKAAMMLLMLPLPSRSSTFNTTSEALGAIPAFEPHSELYPLPAIVPAMWVPCPLSS